MNLTLLSLISLIDIILAYNLIIDIHPNGVNKFFQTFREHFHKSLEHLEIAALHKELTLGSIRLSKVYVNNVEVEGIDVHKTEAEDYRITIQHVHAKVHGDYNHNILLLHQNGDFDLRIRDLNATIGPLIPANYAGLPYIFHNRLFCTISHDEDDFDVHGGILRHIAKNRLKNTLKEDLEKLLCPYFVDILDQGIRDSLEKIPFNTEVNGEVILNFSLSRQPFILPNGAIRYFPFGISTPGSQSISFENEYVPSDHDVTYIIHENLFNEAVQITCASGLFDISTTEFVAKCQSLSISLNQMNETQNMILSAKYEINDQTIEKKFTCKLLFSSSLIFHVRLNSEIVVDVSRKLALFDLIAKLFRDNFKIQLAFPINYRLSNTHLTFLNDRTVVSGNVVLNE